MKKMNKTIEYRGYKFNIEIELNVEIEKRINGKIYHNITINDIEHNINFNISKKVEDKNLLTEIINLESLAKKTVDSNENENTTDQRLYELGFR